MSQPPLHRSPVALISVPALCVAVAAIRDGSVTEQGNVSARRFKKAPAVASSQQANCGAVDKFTLID